MWLMSQVGVVGAGSQMVGRHPVAAQQGEILDVVGGLGLLAVDEVVERDRASGAARHAEAKHEGLACRGAAVAFSRGISRMPGLNSQAALPSVGLSSGVAVIGVKSR